MPWERAASTDRSPFPNRCYARCMPLPLPPAEIRMNSPRERDDAVYMRTARQLATALNEVIRLDSFSSFTSPIAKWPEMSILDFGFGTARLLAGLEQLDRLPARYIGLDIQDKLVEWGKAALEPLGWCEIEKISMHNRRYNADGTTATDRIIPERFVGVDLIVARSVFTHMTAADIAISLREFRRVIGDNGRAYVTVNVKNDVAAWTDNPGKPAAPPLLRVELNKSYFEHIVEDCGFKPSVFLESIENQCAYLLRPV